MIYYIVAWTVLGIACSIVGLAVVNGLGVMEYRHWMHQSDRLLVSTWLGVALLPIALLAASVLIPLSTSMGGLAVIGLCAIALWSSKTRDALVDHLSAWSTSQSWIGALIVAVVAAFMTQPVEWIDAGLYHYSAIQWLFEFGTVRGLGLVMTNLGFTSSWFAIAAPFNPPILDARATATLNGFVLVLVCVTVWQALGHLFQGKARRPDYVLLALMGLLLPLILGLNLLSEILVSPSPDFPVLIVVGIVAWALAMVCDRAHDASSLEAHAFNAVPMGASAIPLLLAIGAVNFKLTAIPALGLTALYFAWQQRRRWRSLSVGAGLVTLLLLPMVGVTILKTGCPLYPSTALCLDLPWSVLEADVAKAASDTHNWVSWYGAPPAGAIPWLWAFQQWLADDKLNLATTALGIVGLGCTGYLLPRLRRWPGGGWVLGLAIAGFAFLLSTAPFLRFTITYLLLPLALVIADLAQHRPPLLVKRLAVGTALGLKGGTSVVGSVAIAAAVAYGIIVGTLVLPPPMRQVQTMQQTVNGVTYSIPEAGELCWATQIPCAFEVLDSLQLRSPVRGLRGGFVDTRLAAPPE